MTKIPAPPPGLYEDVTYEEYDSWEAVRPTVLKELQKDACMELCKWKVDHPKDSTASQIVGNAVHTMAMEPELFDKKYIFSPATYMKEGKKKDDPEVKTPWNWGAGKCKEWGIEQAAKGLTVVKKLQQFPRPKDAVDGMANAISSHKDAKLLLSGGSCEVSIVWVDESTGILCKARIDYLRPGKAGVLVIDIKTALDVNPNALSTTSYKFGYQLQAAMGWDGLVTLGEKPERYLYIFVRNKAPYLVNVVEAEEAVLNMGRSQYKWFLGEWGKCLESGEFPGYNEHGINTLMLPGWAGQEF